jgi:hypothetical protein
MAAGILYVDPYIDNNSTTATGRVDLGTISGGGDFDVTLDDAFLDELGDVGGGAFAVRVHTNSNGSTKIKCAETSFTVVEETHAVSPLPVVKDDGGTVISGCEYILYKVLSTDPMVIAETPKHSGTTNGSGEIASLELPVGDWVILWRDHHATEASAAVDMSHVFTVTAP